MCVRKNIILLILIYLIGSILSGCQETNYTTEEATENLPQIIVGSDDYPPFNYLDVNGNPTGIDVDLAKEAFMRLGYNAVFSKIDWANKDILVDNSSIDCIWGCFSMKGRENDYKWAGPYMISRQVVAVNVNSDIKKLSDLEGKTIAVQATSKPESIFLNRTGSKIPNVKEMYSIENREYIYTSLGKGYVDAIAGHETSIRVYERIPNEI